MILGCVPTNELVAIRGVCKEWKVEIDKVLGETTKNMWTNPKITPETFSTRKLLMMLPRDAARVRLCCYEDLSAYQSEMENQAVIGKGILITGSKSTPRQNGPVPTACGKSCKNHAGRLRQLCLEDELQQTKLYRMIESFQSSLRVLILHNVHMAATTSAGKILNLYKEMLVNLTSIEVLVLHEAFACSRTKLLRRDGRPLAIKKKESGKEFPRIKKLVVSGGSLDVAEFSFYALGRHLSDLCLVDPFVSVGNGKTCLLTSLANQIGSFSTVERLTLEFNSMDNFMVSHTEMEGWSKLIGTIEAGFSNVTSLVVVLFLNLKIYIPEILLLASRLPKLQELKIFVANPYHVGVIQSSENIVELEKNGLKSLKRLSLGSNMLCSAQISGLLQFLPLMENVAAVDFQDTGYYYQDYDEEWFRRVCNDLKWKMFDRLPSLKTFRAKMKQYHVSFSKII